MTNYDNKLPNQNYNNWVKCGGRIELRFDRRIIIIMIIRKTCWAIIMSILSRIMDYIIISRKMGSNLILLRIYCKRHDCCTVGKYVLHFYLDLVKRNLYFCRVLFFLPSGF